MQIKSIIFSLAAAVTLVQAVPAKRPFVDHVPASAVSKMVENCSDRLAEYTKDSTSHGEISAFAICSTCATEGAKQCNTKYGLIKLNEIAGGEANDASLIEDAEKCYTDFMVACEKKKLLEGTTTTTTGA